jgi:hypothetical protein
VPGAKGREGETASEYQRKPIGFQRKWCNLRKSRRGDIVRRATSVFLTLLFLVLASLPALAQRRDQFYNGVRDGGRGGNYYNQRDRDWDRRHRRDQGGIGPGTGALIGGAGGAVLGAALGGGLKGTIIGGAAGAGIGAVLGQANQNSKRDNRYRR